LKAIKQLAGQTAIYGLSSVVPRFLNFLLIPLHTRIFIDTSKYGVISNLYAWLAFLLILLTYGMETGFFRFSNKTKFKKEEVFSTSLISLFITSFSFLAIIIIFTDSIAIF